MLKTDKQMTIKWRDFKFPLSVTEFSIDETSRVATYTYAGMNWALHERVMQYRIITMTGSFYEYSWKDFDWLTATEYIKKLQKSNDNSPWLLIHPVFGTYNCIIHSLKLIHSWETTESDEINNPVPWYSYTIEFWEMQHSSYNDDMDKFFPAFSVKPPNDMYTVSLKYHTCDELYKAIIDWLIAPWLDPIVNAEWLKYDYGIRLCAYNRYLANPNGENNWTTFDKHWNIVANTSSTQTTNTSNTTTPTSTANVKLYTVKVWDTPTSIAKKYWITVDSLYRANKWRNVRTYDLKVPNTFSPLVVSNEWKERKTLIYLHARDVIIIPNLSSFNTFSQNLYGTWNVAQYNTPIQL